MEGVRGKAMNFPGSDSSIVRRSQAALASENGTIDPIKFSIYAVFESAKASIILITAGLLFGILSKFSFGQHLLMRFVSFFSFGWFTRAGPGLEAIEGNFLVSLVESI